MFLERGNSELKQIIFLLFFTISTLVFADGEFTKEDWITGTYSSGMYSPKVFPPSGNPLPLTKKDLTEQELQIVKNSNEFFDSAYSNLGFLMLDKGQIVNERYRRGLDGNTKFFSWSMSKSLTSYTVGYALCTGKIKSLDDIAGIYANNIKDNVFGKSTIKQLLTMSSGAPRPSDDGGVNGTEWFDTTRGLKPLVYFLNQYGVDQINPNEFTYNNSNTHALMYVVDGADNFSKLFEQSIWLKSRPASSSTWLMDSNKNLISASGFSSTLEDWGRLAIESINMRKGVNGECIKNYMKDATTYKTKDLLRDRFFGYGYQTWVDPRPNSQIYLWLGAYGQWTVIDPVSEKILVIFRNKLNREDNNQILKIFRAWIKTN